MNYDEYVAALIDKFWAYAEQEFGNRPKLLERFDREEPRPPKFTKQAADNNLLYPPKASDSVQQACRVVNVEIRYHDHGGVRTFRPCAEILNASCHPS